MWAWEQLRGAADTESPRSQQNETLLFPYQAIKQSFEKQQQASVARHVTRFKRFFFFSSLKDDVSLFVVFTTTTFERLLSDFAVNNHHRVASVLH